MITPDEVRGTTSTLVEAVLAKARGRVIFLMDQKGAGPIYVQGQPSLRGHILFTNAVPGEPDAAFIKCDDGPLEEINALVKQGYLLPAHNRRYSAHCMENWR